MLPAFHRYSGIIEHHPWLIKIADHLIKLGPEGGDKGGYLLKSNTN
jgi:excinuclease ABC subunit A